jgi:hypothetical protein
LAGTATLSSPETHFEVELYGTAAVNPEYGNITRNDGACVNYAFLLPHHLSYSTVYLSRRFTFPGIWG